MLGPTHAVKQIACRALCGHLASSLYRYSQELIFILARYKEPRVQARNGLAEMLGCQAESRWLGLAGTRRQPGDGGALCQRLRRERPGRAARTWTQDAAA